ncbi:MAG TPA: type II toxin-antitoxin system RelE/ParE family toxin [Kiritimatiellia bacterium]|nr:type II toxin-antitoxin system RelE/ParE family toxin [Kiritimatiellia bacterium]HMO99488.1 type II toxin-antitoxin system RelE/ParE family toxin [Kiritimatiellia bacterium]
MKIVILRSAIADLARGRDFYDQQGEGLGDYFEESLTADIDSLRLYAGIHVIAYGYHRMLSKRFPYAIYYEIAEGAVRIRAVLDCRRDPKRIRSRIRHAQDNNGMERDG